MKDLEKLLKQTVESSKTNDLIPKVGRINCAIGFNYKIVKSSVIKVERPANALLAGPLVLVHHFALYEGECADREHCVSGAVPDVW